MYSVVSINNNKYHKLSYSWLHTIQSSSESLISKAYLEQLNNIGRLRKSGGQKINLISLLLNKFLETLHTFFYYPYELRQGNSEVFDFSIKSYCYHFSCLFYAIFTQEVTIKA